jgi:hypothetical protein
MPNLEEFGPIMKEDFKINHNHSISKNYCITHYNKEFNYHRQQSRLEHTWQQDHIESTIVGGIVVKEVLKSGGPPLCIDIVNGDGFCDDKTLRNVTMMD